MAGEKPTGGGVTKEEYDSQFGKLVYGDNAHDIDEVFRFLDKDSSGCLSAEEVRAAARHYGIPVGDNMLDAVFQKMDSDGDGRITLPEYRAWLLQCDHAAREAFHKIDRNHDNKICTDEIRCALEDLKIRATDEEVLNLVRKLNGYTYAVGHQPTEVLYEDFRNWAMFLPQCNIQYVFEHFRPEVDLGEDTSVQALETSTMAPRPLIIFCAGGIAGALSRTVTAPMDRLKTMMQAGVSTTGKQTFTATSLIGKIYREGGIRGFWRGNGANVVKIAPEKACIFYTYEMLQKRLCEDPRHPQSHERFACGALAGAVAQSAIYPLEITKTRLALSTPGVYSGIYNCITTIGKREGIRALYRGLGASVMGIMPYMGTDLTVYNTLKDKYAKENPDKEPSSIRILFTGAFASMVGQVVAYPMQLTRTKLQAQGLPGAEIFTGPVDVMVKTIQRFGIRGIYRGIHMNFAKSCPAIGITYLVYERSKQWLAGVLD